MYEETVSKYAALLGVDINDLKSIKRKNDLTFARQIIWYILRDKLNREQLGRLFNRTHSTVTYSLNLIEMNIQMKDIRTLTTLSILQNPKK